MAYPKVELRDDGVKVIYKNKDIIYVVHKDGTQFIHDTVENQFTIQHQGQIKRSACYRNETSQKFARN